MRREELLNEYTVLVMELQEEYLKRPQDFKKQKALEAQYSLLREELLSRMEG